MLFCVTAHYTPKALERLANNLNTDRREAVSKLLTAAGGKLVALYGTIDEGPGVMMIFDIDPAAASVVVAAVAATDGIHNVKTQRLLTADEMIEVRQKRAQIQATHSPPGH
jgi:uncharacterized protein with GYD domain